MMFGYVFLGFGPMSSVAIGPFQLAPCALGSTTLILATIFDGLILAAAGDDPGGGPWWAFMVPLIILIPLYYYMILKPRTGQGSAKQLLEKMKKNDRVVTIGGIKGIVSKVDRDNDEVTLTIDESTKTKMRVTVGAISRVVSDDSSDKK